MLNAPSRVVVDAPAIGFQQLWQGGVPASKVAEVGVRAPTPHSDLCHLASTTTIEGAFNIEGI